MTKKPILLCLCGSSTGNSQHVVGSMGSEVEWRVRKYFESILTARPTPHIDDLVARYVCTTCTASPPMKCPWCHRFHHGEHPLAALPCCTPYCTLQEGLYLSNRGPAPSQEPVCDVAGPPCDGEFICREHRPSALSTPTNYDRQSY